MNATSSMPETARDNIASRARRDEAEVFVASFRSLYPFEPNFLDVGNEQFMHYVDEGSKTAAPILCLHGNPTWSFYFRGLISGLSTHYRVIAPDHMGCGISDKPQDYNYTLEQHALNIERLVLELDLKNITLVLHDWGGAIGMGFARRHPERIARIVVMNTAAFCSTSIPLRISACRWPIVGPLAVRGFGAFSLAALSMATERPENITDEVRRGYLAPYGDWHNRVATMAFVRDIPLTPSHPSYDELAATDGALREFKDTPICVIWGERDWCFTPEFREEWERRFEGARVHKAPDAGHWVLEDEGPQVLRWISRFLQDTSGSRD